MNLEHLYYKTFLNHLFLAISSNEKSKQMSFFNNNFAQKHKLKKKMNRNLIWTNLFQLK